MSRTLISLALLSLVCAVGCKSQGTIEGDLSTPQTDGKTDGTKTKPTAAKHEHVSFTWNSTDGAHSGQIKTNLPDGETFTGQFQEITAETTVDTLDGFYRSWYGGPWSRYDWTWGGDWPYYGDTREYITYYADRVVALLDGDHGTSMRCRFNLDDTDRGMKGGGVGECQLSNGERITAVFAQT